MFIEPNLGQSDRLLAWPSAHISIRLMSVQRRQTRRGIYFNNRHALIPARAQFARKIFYSTAFAACALFIGVLFGHRPYSQTARSMASTTVDVAALEATIEKNICRDRLCRRRSMIGRPNKDGLNHQNPAKVADECPLLAQNGHSNRRRQYSLSEVKADTAWTYRNVRLLTQSGHADCTTLG